MQIYDDFQWISGTINEKKLYCFYCLIFDRRPGKWRMRELMILKTVENMPLRTLTPQTSRIISEIPRI